MALAIGADSGGAGLKVSGSQGTDDRLVRTAIAASSMRASIRSATFVEYLHS